ncbi:MAG: hypothetical protein ABIO57_01150 [Candidatus Paceibacterota bacterium]
MKPSHILRNIVLIIIGGVFAIGLSYANAAWGTPSSKYTDPSGAAPGGNTATPLNVGGDQAKAGGLGVNAFVASQNAQFDKQAILGGTLFADIGNPGAIPFGGTDLAGIVHTVDLAISGAFSNTLAIKSSLLANSTSSTICADGNGVVVLCDGATETTPVAEKGEFLATGSYSSRYVGFNGSCFSAGGVQKFINFMGHGGCATGQEYGPASTGGAIGSGYQGVIVKLGNNNVLYNTLPGFSTQNGDIARLPYNQPDAPASIWTVQKTGDYQVTVTSNGKITTEIDRGNYFLFAAFDMRVNDTFYPLTANLAARGGNAPIVGHSCRKNAAVAAGENSYSAGGEKSYDISTLQQAFASLSYLTDHGHNGSFWLDLSSPEVQYAFRGSCEYEQKGDWYNQQPFALNYDKTMHFNAGDHVYLYGRLAGLMTQSSGTAYGFDAVVDQNTTFHVVEK